MEADLTDWDERPWAELVEEARRRGVPAAESMGREALIESIRAREHARSGPLSLARSLLGRVASTVARAVLPPERPVGRERPSRPPPAPSAPVQRREESDETPALPIAGVARLADAGFAGMRFEREAGSLALVWRAAPDAIARAQAIAPAGAEMALRVVRVAWPDAEDRPRTEHEDHPARSEGALALPEPAPGERIVAALGLSSADGAFVAISHATLE